MKSEELFKRVSNNYKKPENTLRSYLGLLNQIVLKIKKPFADIEYDDLLPLLREWHTIMRSIAVMEIAHT